MAGITSDGQDEQVLIGSLHDTDEAPHDVEENADAMVEELSPQPMQSIPGLDESTQGQHTWLASTAPVIRTRMVHLSSPILAAKSPFFFKPFSNGMRESEQRDVTLRISSSEEIALMDLLQVIYSGEIQAEKPTTVLDVLMAADKYEVSECIRCCAKRLRKMPMTPECALPYLDLPTSVLLAEAVQPLTDAARQYLASRYRDIARYAEEVVNLPLVGLEAVLTSDDLLVASEDVVYDFTLKWARGHCAERMVLEALFFKAEPAHRQRQLAMEETMQKRYIVRAYKYRPAKVVEFCTPLQQCLVFLDLKLAECKALWPQQRLYSQAFHLGGQGFFLSAHCNMDQQSSFRCFRLFLGMQEKVAASFNVDYEFAARMKPGWEFVPTQRGITRLPGARL